MALSLADRVAVMQRGRVEQVGSPEAIYERPASPFVAEFMGHCNLIDGQVLAPGGARPVFRTDHGLTIPLSAGAAAHGRRGTLALRTTAIALLGPEDAVAPGATVVDGTVRRASYLGALRTYWVALAAGGELRVEQRAGPLGSDGHRVEEGTAVRVAWLPGSCTFQPAAAGPETGR